jgi:serine/threonine-protein kinase
MAGQDSVNPPVAPGEVIAEKYRIERVLGIGGMGFVMAARHLSLDQPVAIKFLIPRHDAEDATQRFQREARASARIESDHVCRVYDTGELPGGIPFMVMEYLEGHDLEVELETRGRLPLGQVVDYVLQALDAVASAHAIGVVHRDLKPSNLFLAMRPDGTRRVKVLDFGISKMLSDAHITDTKGIVGTPAYMSPEQAKNSRKTDLRADIWSLGAILYELLSGRPPYDGETVGEVLALVLNEAPTPLREIAPHLPRGILEVVDKCLTRDRDQRYQSAGELARALAPFAANATYTMLPQSRSHITVDVVPGAAAKVAETALPKLSAARASAETVAGWTHSGEADKRRRGFLLGGAAAGVVGAIAVGALFFGLRASAKGAEVAEGGAAISLATEMPTALPKAEVSVPEVAPRPSAAAPSVVSSAAHGPASRAPGGAKAGSAPSTPAVGSTSAKPAPGGRRAPPKNPLLDSRD